MEICRFCGKECKNSNSLKNHERLCKENPNHIDLSYLTDNGKKTSLKNKGKTSKKQYKIVCPKCGKEHIEYLTENSFKNGNFKKYCSRSCANGHIHSELTKKKISNGVKNYINKIYKENTHKVSKKENNVKILVPKEKKKYICKKCGKEYYLTDIGCTSTFCSRECLNYFKTHRKEFLSDETLEKLRNAGKKSASINKENKRSKNEIMFYELCENYFKNVSHNEPIFNGWDADVIIHDIKYAILWNGPWHYREISKTNTLSQIQNRDKIKIEEIRKHGYIPYVIKDMNNNGRGKYNPDFVKNEFELFKKYIAG